MSDIIRWGMIGCGDVAENKSGPGLSKAEGSSLEMVMSRDAAKTEDFAKRHGIKRWTTEEDEIISDTNVDAIYVATPPDSHCYYSKLVAAAGKPLLVEKPIARNIKEAEELIDCCNSAGVPLFVGYYRRAMPRFNMVKEWIDTMLIGAPRFVHVQHSSCPENHPVSPIDSKNAPPLEDIPWRFIPEISGGGNFVDCATHMIDMVDYLLGPLTEVEGRALNYCGLYPAEDTVSGSFLVDDKIPGTGQWCYAAGTEVDRIEIVGDKGAIRFSCFNHTPLELETASGIEYVEAKDPYVHQPLIQTVVDALHGKGVCPSSGENALRAIRVQSRLLSGYYDRPPGS